MTNDQQNLLNHLNEIKTKTEAWVAEDPKNRWACYPAVDLEMWASQRITTVEQFEHHNLVAEAFEATRSAFGYKPSWTGLNNLTNEELRKEIDFLNGITKDNIEREEREEKAHIAAVEKAMTVHSGFTIFEMTGITFGRA